jgi:hypothetical protein
MIPALACQVTPAFEVPETEAVNVCVPPAEILVALGETVTVTVAPLLEDETLELAAPHAATSRVAIAIELQSSRRASLDLVDLILFPGSFLRRKILCETQPEPGLT